MDTTDAQLTLDSAIDPALRQSPQTNTATLANPLDTPHDGSEPPTLAGGAEAEVDVNRKRKRARNAPKKAGTEADFKRKEANRLAAERSRSRAAEKTKALNKAFATLSAEHDELSAAIGQIELANDMALAEQERKAREERQQREVEAQVEAAIAVAQQEMENGTGGEREERNILAALMSGGMGMEGFEGVGGDEWVQGVESLMKEVETTGRLGELAAVATVPNDGEAAEGSGGTGQMGEESNTPATKQVDSNIDPALDNFPEEILEAKEHIVPQPKLSMFTYDPAEAASATISAVAVVLNAEIEKTIRDEVALTRAAISRIEKEMSKANGGDVVLDDGPSMLPPDILQGQADLEKAIVAAEGLKQGLEMGMDALAAKVISAREGKDAEEAQVAKGVEELLRIAAGVSEAEKGKIMVVLKSIRGYIGNHIWGLKAEANPDDTLLGIAFSTPAIARRRRGRPPKNSFPLRYNHASLIYPSLPLDSPISTATLAGQSASATHAALARKRRIRGLGRSKLGENASDDDEDYLSTLNDAEDGGSGSGTQSGPALLGPNGQPLDPAFQSHEWTESVLSRLKKGGPGSCDICGRTETSVWRKMILGGEDYRVCNACGLYHRKFGVIRPPSLWGDGAEAVKKRRAAVGPEDGRRNRKVKKMLHNADQMKEAAAQVQAEADEVALQAEAAVAGGETETEDHEDMLRMAAAAGAGGQMIPGDLEGQEGEHHHQVHQVDQLQQDRQEEQEEEEERLEVEEEQRHGLDLEGHLDVDVNGFEVIEEELRVLHGEGIFAGME